MKVGDLKSLIESCDDNFEISCRTPNGEEFDIEEIWRIGEDCSFILRRV